MADMLELALAPLGRGNLASLARLRQERRLYLRQLHTPAVQQLRRLSARDKPEII